MRGKGSQELKFCGLFLWTYLKKNVSLQPRSNIQPNMKKLLALVMAACAIAATAQDQLRHIKPASIHQMPKITAEEYQKSTELLESEDLSPATAQRIGDISVYTDLYSGFCSWYCGGVISSVKASSCLKPQGRFNYEARNAHDFNHESVWAEGADGQGEGEWLEYEFPGSCPRITTVNILCGYVKSDKAWRENSRPKAIKMYYMGKPYAILELEDSRTLQAFDVGVLGPHDDSAPAWKLRFEIMSVYPGEKYADTVISELYFDGIDVH